MRGTGRTPRFHLEAPLAAGAAVVLDAGRAHQLRHVLRLAPGASVTVFNAQAGEWRARIVRLDRRGGELEVLERARPPATARGPRLAVAPIRANRLDWLVEKAVELGVGTLDLVLTRRTVVRPTRVDRLAAIAVEAAEQCGRLDVPPISAPIELPRWLQGLPPATPLLVADEAGGEPALPALVRCPGAALLVGPEGGFAPEERALVAARPGTVRVDLGPRILRSETAALVLLAAAMLVAVAAPR